MTALPRACWCFVVDPDDKDRYLMLTVKKNVGRRAKGLSYTIEEAFITVPGIEKPISVPKLVWGGTVDNDANEVLMSSQDPELRGQGKAKKFFEQYLANGAVRSTMVHQAAEAQGINETSRKRARQKLRVESKKINEQWFMKLPDAHPWPTVTEVRNQSSEFRSDDEPF